QMSPFFDQPCITLNAIAIGMLRRHVSQNAQTRKDASKPPHTPTQAIPRSDPQTEEERVRRFLEALGQPPGAKPPPTAARRSSPRETVSHVPPPFRSPLAPLTTAPPPLPAEMEFSAKPPPIPQRIEPRKFTPAIASETIFEIRRAGGADDPALFSRRAHVSRSGQSDLRARLATKHGLR